MLLKYTNKILQNGLEIYHIPANSGSDVISVDIFYKVGSRNEIMGKSGIAHMLEHLNFKSTKNLKAGEFDEIVKGIGGVNNASTGFDYTHYFIKCSSKNIQTPLKLFAELMENLNLNDKEFQPERDVVLEERRWRTDNNPIGYLYFRLFNHAFIYHPYHWTPIGFINDIKNWSIDDIKDFHSIYYQPKNAILIISGDIDEGTAFNQATKYFENIKNSKQIPKFIFKEPDQDGLKRVHISKNSEVEMIAYAFKTPAFNHESQPSLNALAHFLSTGKSSIFEKILVDEKQILNQIYTYNIDNIDTGLFIILGICNVGISASRAEEEIDMILNSVKNGNYINEDDITRIKNLTKTELIYSLDSASKISSLYGSYIAKGDIKPLLNMQDSIEKLSISDICETAKKYLIEKNLTKLTLTKEK